MKTPNSSYRLQFSDKDSFVMVRESLTDICEGSYPAASVLNLVLFVDHALTKHLELARYPSGPGEWFNLSDRDIAQRLVRYKKSSLFGMKAIGRAVAYLKAKGLIEVRFNPVDKLCRRRQVRIANYALLQLMLDEWERKNAKRSHSVSSLAIQASK